jgi:thioredoxin reductase
MYDLLIIGGGPAGLTAAVYGIRKRLNCLLVSPDLGGKSRGHMVVEGAEMHQVIDGADIVGRFRAEMEYLEFARLLERVARLERRGPCFEATTESGRQLEARSVILATGADAVRLDVPGANRYFLKGVAYSTVSYAPLYVGKTVALVGAGAIALRGAAELAQVAHRLYWIAPTHGDLDSPLGRRLRQADNVTLMENWQPEAVEGDEYARRLLVRGPDPEPDGETRTLDVAAVFVELGLRPHSELVREWAEVDDEGHVVVNCGTETSVPGLFAAGDVTHLQAEQVLIAVGDGAKAALAAYEYLLKES